MPLHIQVLYKPHRGRSQLHHAAASLLSFGAKAAPGYMRAKQTIRYINALADLIDKHPRARQMIKIVYIENYDVSTAEIRFPPARSVSSFLPRARRPAARAT